MKAPLNNLLTIASIDFEKKLLPRRANPPPSGMHQSENDFFQPSDNVYVGISFKFSVYVIRNVIGDNESCTEEADPILNF